jgi:predicted nucleotidyltransferase
VIKKENGQVDSEFFKPYLIPLQALQNIINHFNDQGVIIGGIAVSLIGEPRFTLDLDAVVLLSVKDVERILDVAEQQGIEARIPNLVDFARKNRVLLLRHMATDINIDLSLGILPFEVEMIERSQVIEIGKLKIRIPTAEDLIILKAVAHREKDLQDIKAIANTQTEIDLNRISFWLEQFGEVLDFPGLWDEIEDLISSKK